MVFDCSDIKSRWPEYMYRELNEHEQAEFVRHLHVCERCRREEAGWDELFARFDVLAAEDGTNQAPPELVYRVKRQVQFFEDWTRQTAATYRKRLASTLAACFLVCFSGWVGMEATSRMPSKTILMHRISESVLPALYPQSTLSYYRAQGFILPEESENPQVSMHEDMVKNNVKTQNDQI
ncbi:hypothetical protein GF373_09930 [bacterium]|nr:hypothetical protein [bacterium]